MIVGSKVKSRHSPQHGQGVVEAKLRDHVRVRWSYLGNQTEWCLARDLEPVTLN